MNRGLNLDTGNVGVNRRYSFLQTPLEMHVPGLQPPANDDPALHQHHHPLQQPAAAMRHDDAQPSTNIENKEKVLAASPQHDPVVSPYTLPGSPPPPPPEQHPANFAPYADEMIQHTTTPPPVQLQSPRQSDAPVPQYSYGPVPTSPGPLPIKADPSPSHQGPSARPVTVAPDTNPLHSPRIPPATATSASQVPALEDATAYHQPGQVRHPDQEVKGGTWSHSMCDCSNISTCCLGIFCPCVLYGKTQYRLGLKSRKEDPTNLLGYDSCNGSCTAMALLCPCQWLMATIQHTRTRKVYGIPGNVGSDCVRATCCTCCTLIQDETEIKKREEDRARVAAAQGATLISPYVAPAQMSYPPPPR